MITDVIITIGFVMVMGILTIRWIWRIAEEGLE